MADEAEVKIPIRPDGLQMTEHRHFQRVFWTVERLGWAGFAVVMGLALVGLTGRGGWLAKAELQVGAALVEVPRISRRGETVVLHVAFGSAQERHLLALDEGLLTRFDLQEVVPRPLRSAAAEGGLLLQFESLGPAPHHARVYLRARQAGIARIRIAVDGVAVLHNAAILP